ncbi:MAG: helix-turn-helix domain-containing protein [Muribaculaceae bacterium]|nr:helix-turn-helix domain-containing protein [Muribaculaceae bacterium]
MNFFQSEKTDSAILLLTMVVQRDTVGIDDNSRAMMAKARNALGMLNFNKANYLVAYTHFLESIQLDNSPYSTTYLSLASFYLHYGDKIRAFEHLKNFTRNAIKYNHYNEASLGIANILSNNFIEAGIPRDTITAVIKQFLSLPPAAGKEKAYPLAHHLAQGWMLFLENDHLGAIDETKKIIAELDKSIKQRTRHALFLIIAHQYKCAAMKDSSLRYIKLAEDIARNNDYKDLLSKTYSDAEEIYNYFQDSIMGDTYHRKMLEINHLLYHPQELGKLSDINMFYEANKFERRIEILNVQHKMRKKMLWTAGGALIVVIIFLIIVIRQNRVLEAKNKVLFAKYVSDVKEEEKNSLNVKKIENDGNIDVRQRMNVETMKSKCDSLTPDSSYNDYNESKDDAAKYGSSNITDASRLSIRKCIEDVFKDEDIFCREGFSLNELSNLCNSNSRYVSQVINEDLGTTFYQLLNSERVKVACKRFMDVETYGSHTVESIISDLGCKSRSTFSKTFKRITGLSPSEFQRMARNSAQKPS